MGMAEFISGLFKTKTPSVSLIFAKEDTIRADYTFFKDKCEMGTLPEDVITNTKSLTSSINGFASELWESKSEASLKGPVKDKSGISLEGPIKNKSEIPSKGSLKFGDSRIGWLNRGSLTLMVIARFPLNINFDICKVIEEILNLPNIEDFEEYLIYLEYFKLGKRPEDLNFGEQQRFNKLKEELYPNPDKNKNKDIETLIREIIQSYGLIY